MSITIPAGTRASLQIAVQRMARSYEVSYGMLVAAARDAGARAVDDVYQEQQERLYRREEAEVITDTGLARVRRGGASAGRYDTGNMADSVSTSGATLKATRPGVYQGYVGWLPMDFESYFAEQEEGFETPGGNDVRGAYSLETAIERIWGASTVPETGSVADGHFQQALDEFYRRVR